LGVSKQSKTVLLLDELARRPEGMTFRELQKFIWNLSNPDKPFTRALRGYWCTNLTGGRMYHRGLLDCFAYKADNRYFRNHRSHFGQPWKVLMEYTKEYYREYYTKRDVNRIHERAANVTTRQALWNWFDYLTSNITLAKEKPELESAILSETQFHYPNIDVPTITRHFNEWRRS
jgi:hypothetical protein